MKQSFQNVLMKNLEMNLIRKISIQTNKILFNFQFFNRSSEDEAFEEEIEDISYFGTIPNIIDELKTSEERYIQNLKEGIEYYVNPLDNKKLPESLKGQKYRMFSVIERILDFHEFTFLPAILESNNDVQKIAEVFLKYIKVKLFHLTIKKII